MNKEKMKSMIIKSQQQFLIEVNEQSAQITRHLIMYLADGKEEAQEQLLQFFHRVKGTSGTLELNDISVRSEEIEELLGKPPLSLTSDQSQVCQLIKKTGELLGLIEDQIGAAESAAEATNEDTRQSSSAKVLIVSENIPTLNEVEEILMDQGLDVYLSSNLKETTGYLESGTMDLAIIDHALSKDRGINLSNELSLISSKTPVIFIGGTEQQFDDADQFYLKLPLESDQLISYADILLNDLKKYSADDVKDRSTVAFNRKQFMPHFEDEKQKFETYGDIFSVAFLDIDGFKEINESYGDRFGDYILLCIVEIIGNHLTEKGKIYRFGGDEFLVLFPETGGKEAEGVIRNVREDLSSITFEATDNQSTLALTFSAGIAEYNTESLNKTTLLEEADKALYAAREKGGNQSILMSRSTKVSTNRILVVDDEVLLANIIKTRLGYLGYEVDHAKDGQEALTKLDQKSYDLILLDIMLPKVTGIEVLKTFKNKYNESASKIIMISGKHSEAAVLESLRLGADDFFKKPFSLDVLEHKIKKILTS